MQKKKVYWGTIKWLLVLIVIVITGFFIFKYLRKTPKGSYITIPVKKGKISVVVRGRGEVIPFKTYKITSSVFGRIESVFKDEGDYVEKGDLLLSIDKTEYLAKLKHAESEILESQNRLAELEDNIEIEVHNKEIEEAKISYEDAKREYYSNCRLYELKGVSKDELKKAESQLEKARLSLILKENQLSFLEKKRKNAFNLISLQIKEAKANYEWIKKQLSLTDIKSPISGIIIEKNQDIIQGFTITQGAYLFTIIPNLYQVKGFIDEIDILKINIGDKGIIRFDAYPYQPCNAVIRKISPKPIIPEGKIGIRKFEVYLDINPPFKITPNMQCSLEIKKIASFVLKVNLEDVEEDDGKRYVYLIKDGKKIKREIKTGFESETEAEVLSGLKEGDIIIKR